MATPTRFHHPNNHPYPHSSSKIIIFFCLSAFLGLALFANVFRASLSAHYLSIATNWVDTNAPILLIPNATATPDIKDKDKDKNQDNGKGGKSGKRRGPDRFLSSTFADLPAPELYWEQMPSAPVPRLDGYSVQINNMFYVFGGYEHLDLVHSHVDVFDFTVNKWVDQIKMPDEMANSHLGVATDGRYVYIVTGQYGTQCRGPTTASFTLDTVTKKWKPLPPLPEPRYAPATQLWKGRLHVMGGSKENRHTPGLEHWSLAVKDGEALEQQWREEVPVPRGGPHRACVAVGDRLFVIGGQEGDFMAKPGSPIFKCSRRVEVVYGDVYMLEADMKWKILPAMPKANSHIECAWVLVNNSIVITGGTTEKHPVTKRMMLVGEVFRFDLNTMTWSVIGKLPYRIKTTLAGFWDGWLYFTSGQRDRGPDNPQPKKVVGEMWRTKLHLS
ncbi:kelch repeat-containing protein At3g27220-like [Vigna unguiculata]|nr:kelch repeat-containing protein At3g27220-like [Vigna unguiculata]QCE10693.1 kelch-like protein 38 [Vigna unguiculata]